MILLLVLTDTSSNCVHTKYHTMVQWILLESRRKFPLVIETDGDYIQRVTVCTNIVLSVTIARM